MRSGSVENPFNIFAYYMDQKSTSVITMQMSRIVLMRAVKTKKKQKQWRRTT